jgi:hypothetical protein
LSNKRRGTFAENVKDYIAELRTVVGILDI